MESLEKAFTPLSESDCTVILPTGIYEDYPLKHIPLAIEVKNPIRPELSLVQVARCLVGQNDLANFFYIMPLYNGFLFLKGAYRIGVDQIQRIAGGDLNQWDFLRFLELPQELKKLLPQLPRAELPRLNILGSVNALLGQLPSLVANYEKISMLRTSESRFDKEQYARLQRQLIAFLDELRRIAAETKVLIAAEFPEAGTNPSLRSCLDFLETLEKIESPETLRVLLQSGRINGDRILDNLLRTVAN